MMSKNDFKKNESMKNWKPWKHYLIKHYLIQNYFIYYLYVYLKAIKKKQKKMGTGSAKRLTDLLILTKKIHDPCSTILQHYKIFFSLHFIYRTNDNLKW